MKKKLLIFLSIVLLSTVSCSAYSKTTGSSDMATAIRLYKAGNYTECYVKLNDVIKKEPSNAYAYYYLAMTYTQTGKKDEAIANYSKAIALSSPNTTLNRYATKGKRCLETPDKCQDSMYASELDEFISKSRGAAVTKEVQSDYEKLKIENMMREINRSDDIEPQKFREYKDFSSMNETPSNDEIVAALKTLKNAGFGDLFGNNNSDLSLLTGSNQQSQLYNMFGGNMSPQLIQAMLMNNLSTGF
jgi:tetratricopeptide (TPR) repeat protein